MKFVLSVAAVSVLLVVNSVLAQDRGAALRRAVMDGDAAAVSKLAASKDVVNSGNPDGVTALMLAAALDKFEIVTILLKQGADLNAKTRDRSATPLMFAADFGRLEIARLLVEKGADPKATDSKGYTAIDYFVMPNKGDTEDTEADRARHREVAKFLQGAGTGHKLTADNALGRLLAIGECDLSSVVAKAKDEGK